MIVVAVLAYIAVTYYQKFKDLSLLYSTVLAKLAKPYKEEVLFNNDTLSKIVSYLPSNDLLSLALTCRRLGMREEGESSLHDEALFRQPPPLLEDCPICRLRIPTHYKGSKYQKCCGKKICSGCVYASFHDNQGNVVVDNPKCPFCRAPRPLDHVRVRRMKKRAEAGDTAAMLNLGAYHRHGVYGLAQDYTKALELYHRAAELGYARAYTNIGCAYGIGEGVEVDKKKSKYYYELAAMKGCTSARYNLGNIEKNAGNMDRALKHYLIAVRDGHDGSLKNIQQLYSDRHVPKDDYTIALRSYQEYLDEIKSDQRDKAAADREEYRYY